MKTTHLIVLLLAGTCAPSIAQRPQGPPPTDPVIEAIDKNGKLDSEEAGLKEDDENGGPSGRSGPPQGGQGKGGP
ncbi:hypothetical protein N9Z40_05195, partial [Akkermansiaceae bacterium]|nr:hypothetical protein [Akkermansiaceae bacterium]